MGAVVRSLPDPDASYRRLIKPARAQSKGWPLLGRPGRRTGASHRPPIVHQRTCRRTDTDAAIGALRRGVRR
jgi:hypothetical protein